MMTSTSTSAFYRTRPARPVRAAGEVTFSASATLACRPPTWTDPTAAWPCSRASTTRSPCRGSCRARSFSTCALEGLARVHREVAHPFMPAEYLHTTVPAGRVGLDDVAAAEDLHSSGAVPAVVGAVHRNRDARVALHRVQFWRTGIRQHVDIEPIGVVLDRAGDGLTVLADGCNDAHVRGAQQLLDAVLQLGAGQDFLRPGRLDPLVRAAHG